MMGIGGYIWVLYWTRSRSWQNSYIYRAKISGRKSMNLTLELCRWTDSKIRMTFQLCWGNRLLRLTLRWRSRSGGSRSLMGTSQSSPCSIVTQWVPYHRTLRQPTSYHYYFNSNTHRLDCLIFILVKIGLCWFEVHLASSLTLWGSQPRCYLPWH